MSLQKTTYDCKTNMYPLSVIFDFYKDNRLNFNLDCQRGYI